VECRVHNAYVWIADFIATGGYIKLNGCECFCQLPKCKQTLSFQNPSLPDNKVFHVNMIKELKSSIQQKSKQKRQKNCTPKGQAQELNEKNSVKIWKSCFTKLSVTGNQITQFSNHMITHHFHFYFIKEVSKQEDMLIMESIPPASAAKQKLFLFVFLLFSKGKG